MTDTSKQTRIIARITEAQAIKLDKELKVKGMTASEWIRYKIDSIRGTK